MKPFLEREVNDDIFYELMYDRLDEERVTLNFRDFKQINFGLIDIP